MKVKCKICGAKGFHNLEVTEYWASKYLFVGNFFKNKIKSYYICRKCVGDILESLRFEQNRINDLYEPEIKEKKKKSKA